MDSFSKKKKNEDFHRNKPYIHRNRFSVFKNLNLSIIQNFTVIKNHVNFCLKLIPIHCNYGGIIKKIEFGRLNIYIYIYIYIYICSGSALSFWLAVLAHWIGIHFDQPFFWAHRLGWVCLGSGGCRLRPSDMDSGKPAFMWHALESQGAVSQALTLSWLVRFIAWYLMSPPF